MITISFKTKASEAFCPWCKARIGPALRQYEHQCTNCGSYFQLRDEFDEQRAAEAESCGNCKCWRAYLTDGPLGDCRRFPRREMTGNLQWCGEWRAKR